MAGKTTLVAAMVAAVASGDSEFLGRKVNAHGDVLVVSTDSGEPNVWGRRTVGYGVEDSVYVTTYRPRDWADLHAVVARDRYALLVFDNVLGAITGDVRDNSAAAELLGNLKHVAQELRVPVLAVAHSSARKFEDGTHSKGPMGSTTYDAWDRLTVHVEPGPGPGDLTIDAHGNETPACVLRLAVDMNGNGTARYELKSDTPKVDKRPRATETLDRNNELCERIVTEPQFVGLTQKQIAPLVDISEAQLSRILRGKVRRDRKSGAWTWA